MKSAENCHSLKPFATAALAVFGLVAGISTQAAGATSFWATVSDMESVWFRNGVAGSVEEILVLTAPSVGGGEILSAQDWPDAAATFPIPIRSLVLQSRNPQAVAEVRLVLALCEHKALRAQAQPGFYTFTFWISVADGATNISGPDASGSLTVDIGNGARFNCGLSRN